MTPVLRSSRRHGTMARLAGAALTLFAAGGIASAQSVVFQGHTFVNRGLVGVARVPSNARDQFGDTLGGFGSATAMDLRSWRKDRDGSYHGTLYMVPDRGWNTQGTVTYRGRRHHFDVTLNPLFSGSTAAQNQLRLDYRGSLPFHHGAIQTTGLDPTGVLPKTDRFPALPANNGSIPVDNEGIVEVGDGTLWISDEYGPYAYHYSRNGDLLQAIRPPEAFVPKRLNTSGQPVDNFSANSPPTGVTLNTGNPVSGRQNNQGFEGLAMSPDRKTLFILLQSALIQDLDSTSATIIKVTRHNTRLLAYDVSHKEPRLIGEYVVQLPLFQDQTVTNKVQLLTAVQSEMLALNDHQFLVLARDSGAGFTELPQSVYRSIDLIDISRATNIANTQFDDPAHPVAPLGVLNKKIVPAAYQKFLDINDNAQLNRFGLPNDANDLYEKWESLAVVPVNDPHAPHDYFLFVGSDNDFITQDGSMIGVPYRDVANVDTLVPVYRVTLPTYIAPKLSDDRGEDRDQRHDHDQGHDQGRDHDHERDHGRD